MDETRGNATPATSRLGKAAGRDPDAPFMGSDEPDPRPVGNPASRVIGTILKHDRKVTSYKLALIRALNDVVLSFPDAGSHGRPIAVPLRILAEYCWRTTGLSSIHASPSLRARTRYGGASWSATWPSGQR